MPSVNITMVTFNRLELTRNCLQSLLPTLGPGVTLTVVDNGSKDGTPGYLQKELSGHPGVRLLLLKRNMGVAVAANLGWAELDAEHYVKLDNDMEIIRADWLDRLLDIAESAPEVGQVGHRVCSWHKYERVTLSSGRPFLSAACCNGACALIPRRTHQRFGFWTEDYGRYGHEDLDYSNRVRFGALLTGYADGPEAVRHLGYEQGLDEGHEALKRTARTSAAGGERAYLLNTFLFERGVRDLYVPRKYLPEAGQDGLNFRLNEDYKPVMRLLREFSAKANYELEGEMVRFNLEAFKEK